MDHIDSVFGTLKDNIELHPAVRYAIALGKGNAQSLLQAHGLGYSLFYCNVYVVQSLLMHRLC